MVDSRRKHRALQQRAEDFRQQEIGDRFQLIAGCGMPRDLQSKLAQMLHRPPNFGAAGAQFLGDTRSTDDDGGVVAQQAHNAAETCVSGTVWLEIRADWLCAGDNKIMRERRRIGQIKIASWRGLSRVQDSSDSRGLPSPRDYTVPFEGSGFET